VQYMIPLQIDGQTIKGCPANAHINLALMPAGDSVQFGELLKNTNYEGFWPITEKQKVGWLPIDQATDMTIDQFYETFRDNPDACLSTPAELWK